MSILDGIVGGLVSAGVTSMVSSFVESHGGVQGIVSEFQQKGFGDTVASWVSTGTNQAITPEQISSVLGEGKLAQLASSFGLSADEISQKLSEHLPAVIDKLTPNGEAPDAVAA